MGDSSSALSNVRIVDLTDERAIYGVKLLADLGADVVRIEPKDGDPLRRRGPFDDESKESLWHLYFASSRRFLSLDESDSETPALLNELCAKANLVIATDGNPFIEQLDYDRLKEANAQIVFLECTSFGEQGEWRDFLAPDLIAGALGGSVGVTGDADTPPLKPFGDLNFTVSGAYVAVAALAGLRAAREFGIGQRIHVPVHECIASSLEHVFMWYQNNDQLPNARAKALERRGSLHWTDLYHVMYTRDGAIMVTPTPSIDSQLAWLIEEDAFDDLLDPEYQEPEKRRFYARRMMEVIRSWVAEKRVEELFFSAQDHHAPYGWVQELSQVAANPQLAAREWWTQQHVAGRSVKAPGVPYRHSETPASVSMSETVRVSKDSIVEDCGWGT